MQLHIKLYLPSYVDITVLEGSGVNIWNNVRNMFNFSVTGVDKQALGLSVFVLKLLVAFFCDLFYALHYRKCYLDCWFQFLRYWCWGLFNAQDFGYS